MPKIIFVHGMNGTAESWNTIPNKVADAGYDVHAINLPGHDTDMGLMDIFNSGQYHSGLSMDDYIDAIASAFPAGDARDVVLVGHSMGGAVISHVAQKYPERVLQLIYVAAMLPDSGESVSSIIDAIKAENVPVIKTLGDYLPHLSELRLVLQPEEPLAALFTRSPAFDALPRGYILCQEDDVIPLKIQEKMLVAYATASAKTGVKKLPFSHLLQYDNPQVLFESIQEMLLI